MSERTIQFGKMPPVVVRKAHATKSKPRKNVATKRQDVPHDGPEANAYAKYDHDVKFANIPSRVNVTRVKLDDHAMHGVVKGALLAEVPIVVPKNDSGATLHAMKKRCDYAPGEPDMEVFKTGHNIILSKFNSLPTITPDRESILEYVSKYSSSKAERLLAVLEEQQLNWDGDAKHVFAKQEVLLKEHGSQPRVVYQGTDMYNLVVGCVQHVLAERMKKVFSLSNPLNTGNKFIFAAGLHNEELGDIIEHSPGSAIENDMKNNDGSQNVKFRKYEAMFYAKLGAPMWWVKEFARNQTIRVWTRYGVTASVTGQMRSGEQDTTTTNSYVGMVNIAAALDAADIRDSTNIHGGDDYLGFVPAGEETKFVQSIETVVPALAMSPEPAVPASREHATFYRKRYVRGVNGTRGVPQFGRVLAKINLRANQNSQVSDRDYMAGKYLSAAYEHRYVPGISQLLLQTSSDMSDKPYIDHNTNREVGHKGAEFIRQQLGVVPLDDSSYSGFLHDVYGLTPDDVLDAYTRVAQSSIDWLHKYTYVDKKGICRSKPDSPIDKLSGDSIEALRRVDLGF